LGLGLVRGWVSAVVVGPVEEPGKEGEEMMFITAGPSTKLCRGGEQIVEDMCLCYDEPRRVWTCAGTGAGASEEVGIGWHRLGQDGHHNND
jgi:hypothetical protein